jgi:hypothetical protein
MPAATRDALAAPHQLHGGRQAQDAGADDDDFRT